MNQLFDSRDPFHRRPVGAVEEETRIHFKIRLPRDLRCSASYLLVQDDKSKTDMVSSMFWCGMDGDGHEFWECDFAPPESGLYWYRFELETCRGRMPLLKGEGGKGALSSGTFWQLTVYEKGFQTPGWLCGGIFYQIFPDRFYRPEGPVNNPFPDRTIREDWGGQPYWRPNERGEVTNSDYFGGTLRGIEEKLPYLKSLHVTCLYLNPIFEAHSNHRYNTADYTKIDPVLGTEEDFQSLCAAAGRLGIRVMLDGVFSHTGSDSVYFNRQGRYPQPGAYQSQQSPYFSWYHFISWPEKYHSWWGFETLPEVEETDNNYNKYINGRQGVVRKWLKKGASGWRLDVADELPDSFLDQLTEAAKEEKPDAVVLGEVWEDATTKESYGSRRRYLLGRQLDSVMNYPFRNAVLGFFTGADAAQIAEGILSVLENYPPQVVRMLMNHIGTHDTERAVTVLAGEPSQGRGREWQSAQTLSSGQRERGVRLMMAASAMQYTLPGVPCVYYGDEAGMEGYKDPFNRGCYPWGRENQELLAWYRRLGEIREEHPVFKEGSFRLLKAKGSLLAYVREDPEGKSPSVLCAFCSGKNPETLDLPLEFQSGTVLLGGSLKDRILTLQGESCCLIRAARDLSAFAAGEERDMKIYVPNVPKA